MRKLDPTRDPTQPAIWLTRLKMTRFDLQPDWPANPIDSTWPARFVTSRFKGIFVSTCSAHLHYYCQH